MRTKEIELGGVHILTIVFLVLKLCGVIHWSWLWVLSPTWIPLAVFFFACAVVFLIGLIK